MKFAELKSRTVADLREVARIIERRAAQVDDGDLAVMDKLMEEEFQRLYEMLLIRYSWGCEQRQSPGGDLNAESENG